MKKDHDKIASRLALILQKLNDGGKFTKEELCEEFNVSERTIHRDLTERLSFLPLKCDKGYYGVESFALGNLSFKDIQAFATLSGIKSLYPSLTNEFIVDILNAKTNQAYLIKSVGYENLTPKQKIFEDISASILQNHQIECNYKEKKRVLNPYKLINTNGIWYLVADEEGILKTFTFSKLSNIKSLDISFTPNTEFIEIITKNEANWFSQTVIEITLQIDSKIAEYFLRRAILPNQKIVEQNDDFLIISTKVSYEDEIMSTVKYWLPYVKILEPMHLQTKLTNLLQTYLNS